MAPLAILFGVKLAMTAPLVVLLAAMPDRAARWGGLDPGEIARPYAAALAALLVGYGFGLADVVAGRFPLAIVVVAAVSNLGAAAALMSLRGRWQTWVGAAVFGAIGAAAAWAALDPTPWMGVSAATGPS